MLVNMVSPGRTLPLSAAKAKLSEVAQEVLAQPTDEVDQERISRRAEQVVKRYFETLEREAAAQ